MPPKSVKLNGGAASHVASADDFSYADLDLIFPMDVENSDSFDKVRSVSRHVNHGSRFISGAYFVRIGLR